MPGSITKQWNTQENYWVLNPMMLTIREFKELHEKDKKKSKEVSSKMMWAIAMVVDPHEENPWRNTSLEDRKVLIAEDFLEDVDFPWEDDDIQLLINTYKNRCLTIGEKALIDLEDKLADRAEFIAGTKYSMDSYDDNGKVIKGTADQLDKMMVNTHKIYEQMEKVKGMLDKEAIESQGRGGAQESASEQGLI